MKCLTPLLLVLFIFGMQMGFAGEEPVRKPSGLEKRIPWTTSKVKGTPDPPHPYVLNKAFPLLKFKATTDLSEQPGSNWLINCEQYGQLNAFFNDAAADKVYPFLNVALPGDHPGLPGERRRQVWSVTFHPKYWENKFVYVAYGEVQPAPRRTRISRYLVKQDTPTDPPVADPKTETIIFEWVSAIDHHGGAIKFGPDGMLYASAGDGAAYADGNLSGQDITDINASIVRIDVDKPPAGQFYGIPKDNPFVTIAGARGEIWAYGLRNIWKMSFDKKTGELWAADVGQDLWDYVCIVEKGGNYGWSVTEGSHPFRPERAKGPTPILKPVIEFDHSIARSLTGGYVYRGKRLKELYGYYIFGDYATGLMWATKVENGKVVDNKEICRTPYRIVGFCEDNDGEIYVVDHQGPVYRIDRTPASEQGRVAKGFPRKLSETGIFADTAAHKPAPGVIPYDVNMPIWRDHATMERFVAVPDDAKIDYRAEFGWNFPDGAVAVQTVFMEMETGNPATRRRMETRLLHKELGNWWSYTYVWNDAQTDAELLTEKNGRDTKLSIKDAKAPNGVREQAYHFPGRAECTLCHTMPMNYVLGLSTLQMNRDYNYDGVLANQIKTFESIGLLKGSIEKAHDPNRKMLSFEDSKLAPLSDESASAEKRARGYFHVNCAHCHSRWGGGNSPFFVVYTLPLVDTNIIDVKPAHGNIDLTDARLIAPGHPEKSVLLERIKRLDHYRMPRAGSALVDEKAVKLIEKWILELK